MAIDRVRPTILACAGIAAMVAVPVAAYAGGAPSVGSGVGMYGAWAVTAQSTGADAITWFLQSPVAPVGGLYGLTFYSNEATGERFDCTRLAVQQGSLDASHAFQARAVITHRSAVRCGQGAISIRVPPVPAGLLDRVVIPTSITAAQASYAALGVITMSGRSDIHVHASSLTAPAASSSAPASSAGSSTSSASTSAPASSTAISPSPATSSPALTSPVAGDPTGRPLEAAGGHSAAHLGTVGSTVLALVVALAVLVVAAGLSLIRRRSR